MVDIVSIVIAVVSLIGSLVAAGFTGWISYYLDQVKQRKEAKALVHKYRDPLMLAAYDLQSRLWGLVQHKLLSYADDENKRDLVYIYTSFLVGQYLSWTYILRRQAQFLRFSTDKTNKQLNKFLDLITGEFAVDRPGEEPFMLWRGQQMAIGESMAMAEGDGGQLYCMGFAAFEKQYNTEPGFKKWFNTIESGITQLVEANKKGNPVATNRLRRLQHLLVDLVLLLDEDKVTLGGAGQYKQLKVDAAHECTCDKCPGIVSTQSSSVSPITKLPEP